MTPDVSPTIVDGLLPLLYLPTTAHPHASSSEWSPHIPVETQKSPQRLISYLFLFLFHSAYYSMAITISSALSNHLPIVANAGSITNFFPYPAFTCARAVLRNYVIS